jgi:phage terminase large subunit-like protein
VGFADDEIEAHFVEMGQGIVSMSPALRDLESDILEGRVAHGNHPVLTMCAYNAVVHRDAAGNRKLDKGHSRGRIDGMVALAMAKAMAGTHTQGETTFDDYLARMLTT